MKKMNNTFLLVAQIFAILGAVGYGFASFVLLMITISPVFINMMPVTLLYLALAVLDIIAAYKLSQARNGQANSQTALGWSIYLLIGAGLIGGIFGILGAQGVGMDQTSLQAPVSGIEAKLEELDRLYNRGLLTRDEYLARRKKIILED